MTFVVVQTMTVLRLLQRLMVKGIFQYFSVDGNQGCHSKEKGGEIAAPEVSTVLLQRGLQKKHINTRREYG